MFDERDKGQAMVFAANRALGQPVKTAVSDGDSVTLRIDGEDVLLRSIKVLGNARYTGIIYGFEPTYELEYHGLDLGDEVVFEEKHIIVCSED
jgi:hypothetical protein